MEELAGAVMSFIFIMLAGYLFVTFVLPYLILIALVAAGVWLIYLLYSSREGLVRWYYFTFYPHPAAPIVRASLDGRRFIAGAELATALGEVPPNNRILREVRIAQGEQLVLQMQRMSERTINQTIQYAQADNARAAMLGIQEAVALAAVALERAKAAHAASNRAG